MARARLYANPGWGSAIIEAQLVWLGVPCEIIDVGDVFSSVAAREALLPANPLAQIPTLVLQDGMVLTESAAMTLYLAELTGRDDFVPASGSPERAAFLRWLAFLVAN